MDNELQLQRWLDGELSPAEAQGVERLLAGRQDLAVTHARHEALDVLLTARRDRLDGHRDRDDLVAAVLAKLPAGAPSRAPSLTLNELLMASLVLVTVVMAFWLAGSMRDLIPLYLMSTLSVVVGGLLVLAAAPLRHLEAGLWARLLGRRVTVASGDVLVTRAAGLGVLIGGLYLALAGASA